MIYLLTRPHASFIKATPGMSNGDDVFGFHTGLYSNSLISGCSGTEYRFVTTLLKTDCNSLQSLTASYGNISPCANAAPPAHEFKKDNPSEAASEAVDARRSLINCRLRAEGKFRALACCKAVIFVPGAIPTDPSTRRAWCCTSLLQSCRAYEGSVWLIPRKHILRPYWLKLKS